MSEDIDPEIQTALDNIKKDLTAIETRADSIRYCFNKLGIPKQVFNTHFRIFEEVIDFFREVIKQEIENQYNKSEES